MTTYEYTALGNLFRKTDARGVSIVHSYDLASRLTGKSYSGGLATPAVSLAYYANQANCAATGANCTGLLRQVSVGARDGLTSSTTYEYDSKGRVTRSRQSTGGVDYNFEYGYDTGDRMELMVYPSGKRVRTCHDAAGQAVSVSRVDAANTVQQAYATSGVYGPDGALESIRIGALDEVRGYTASRRLKEIRATHASGQPQMWKLNNYYCQGVLSEECAASNSNVYFQKVTAGALTFDLSYTYDARNRLKTAVEAPVGGGAGWSQQYSHDVFGNRWMTGSAPGGSGTPSTEASIDAATNRLVGYGYDPAGHQTGAGSRFMEWDGEGRMVREGVVVSGTETASRYYYDGEGRRVRRVAAGGASVDYVYDALGRLAMEQGAGGTPGCRTGCYVTADHLGSTRLLTDQTGALVGRFDYMPFGEAIVAGQSFSNGRPSAEYGDAGFVAQKFTGKERDPETSLDYFGARYMSAAQGRFTSPDSPFADQDEYDSQSWNLYSYVRHNPLRFIDPTGRECVTLDNGTQGDDGNGTVCKAVTDADKIKKPDVTVGVGWDQARLFMLAGIGESLSSPHQIATVVSGGMQGAASVMAPLATAIGQCLTGKCSQTDVALAAIPRLPGASMQRFVKNRKLLNILDNWNRAGTGAGTGSTADAIRQEILTGSPVGGKFHFQKGEEVRRGLMRLMRDPNLDSSDRAVVKELLIDLQDALSTPRR